MSEVFIAMPDAVNVNLLPAGYPAYLGYADGQFRTGPALQAMFPEAELVLLSVNGRSDAAHGMRVMPGTDIEPGDVTAATAAAWTKLALASDPGKRPVLYASVQGDTGAAVRTVQGLCNARMPVAELAIDGAFGPLTWPVLLSVA